MTEHTDRDGAAIVSATIHSNGSKWMGQPPDSIDALIDVLGEETLDPRFEDNGNFIIASRLAGVPSWSFFGNFLTTSHVFSIDTDDPEIAGRLTTAIRANQAAPAYQAARAREAARRAAEKPTTAP